MPTIFSHAVAATALGVTFNSLPVRPWQPEAGMPIRFWLLSLFCAILPDADVISFALGIRYRDLLGHRGLSHSLLFALALGWLIVAVCFPAVKMKRIWLAGYFFIVTFSHACLDALTNGGLGVALLAPFSNARYFFPWRPIAVSPIGADFFTARGGEVMLSELVWVWGPSLLIIAICRVYQAKDNQVSTER